MNSSWGRWLALALILAGLAFYFIWRGDRRQISRRLDHLEELMSKHGVEEQLVSFGVAREISSLFVDGFMIRADPWEGSLIDRKELTGALMRYRTAAQVIEASVGSRELEIDGDLGLATLLGVSEVVMDFGGREGRERRKVRIEWVREDGDWLIREVELLEAFGGGLVW